jgi:hypothetical protein
MKKALLTAGLVVMTVLVSGALFQAAAGEAVTIDDCVNKKSAVEFPHEAHFELTECTTCHHTAEGLTADSDMEVKPCGACHTEPEGAETPKCSEMSLSKNPFHINCVGCHKESGSENAPTKCDGCHPKAE